jgi:hypothetical protein
MIHTCSQCGASYDSPGDSCVRRFEALLALDHSRQEPWGTRHGSAFAAFTLQHPEGQSANSLERSWELLYRVWILGQPESFVTRGLRLPRSRPDATPVPPFPELRTDRRFRLTIADLGTFAPHDYARLLENWCRTTLEAYGAPTRA